jgi:hypothetical protein
MTREVRVEARTPEHNFCPISVQIKIQPFWSNGSILSQVCWMRTMSFPASRNKMRHCMTTPRHLEEIDFVFVATETTEGPKYWLFWKGSQMDWYKENPSGLKADLVTKEAVNGKTWAHCNSVKHTASHHPFNRAVWIFWLLHH